MTLLSFLGQCSVAGSLIGLAVLLPGYLGLRMTRLTLGPWERLAVAATGGAGLLTLVYWVLSFLGLPQLLWVYVLVCGGLELGFFIKARWFQKPAIYDPEAPAPETWQEVWPLALWLLAGIVLQTRFTATTGWFNSEGLRLLAWHAHDAPWHIFNLHQLARTFPPQMPGFAGWSLQNYHMFSDLLWGALLRLAPLDPWHVYFRIAPVLYSALLSLNTFVAVRAWARNKAVAYLAVGLTVFCSNWGYMLPLFFGYERYFLWDSILWVSSPFLTIFNPGVSSSYAFLLLGMWALVSWEKQRAAGYLAVLALAWGVLPGFKVYPGLLALCALGATGLSLWILRRDASWLKAWAIVLPVFLGVFLPPNLNAPALVRFLPGFNLGTMLVAPDRMALMSSAELKMLYVQQPWLVVLLMAGLLLWFLVGNLGVRSLGLISLVRAWCAPQRADPILLFIAVFIFGALLGAVAFVQVGMPWNTVQFFYYAVVLSAWPAAKQIWNWLDPWPRPWAYLGLGLVALLGLPGVIQAWRAVDFHTVMNSSVCSGLQWLRSQARPQEVILRPLPDNLMSEEGYRSWQRTQTRGRMTSLSAWQAEAADLAKPQDQANTPAANANTPAVLPPGPVTLERTDTAIVAGWTYCNTYVEDTVSAQIMGYPVEKRVQATRSFYQDMDILQAREFLEQEHISYVILWGDMALPFDLEGVPLKKIFQNEALTILKYISVRGW